MLRHILDTAEWDIAEQPARAGDTLEVVELL